MDQALEISLCIFMALVFNTGLFLSFGTQCEVKVARWLEFGVTGLLFVALAALLSFYGLSLAECWLFMALLFLAEVHLIYRCRKLVSCFLASSAVIFGVACNLISRIVVAMYLGIPVRLFNLPDAVPPGARLAVFVLAFSLASILLWGGLPLLAQRKYRYLNGSTRNLCFTLAFIFVEISYLALILLLFTLPVSELALKFWGIKASICALLGYYMGVWYAVRESGLEYFETKNAFTREKLVSYRQHEEDLEVQAFTDELTGCRNRIYGKQALNRYQSTGELFTLCFVDINGLKLVNDTLGHSQGNRYICVVAHALGDALTSPNDELCRFGGDEFCLLFHNRRADAVERLIKDVAGAIENLSWSAAYPFDCSISYGIVQGDECASEKGLLGMADERMYEQKMRTRAARLVRQRA